MIIVRREPIGLITYDYTTKQIVEVDESILSRDDVRFIDHISSKTILGAPIFISIYPSYICNFNCIFCYNKQLNSEMAQKLSKKQIDAYFKLCSSNGIFYIDILGGEPLHPTNWPITKYILIKSKKLNMPVYITTNLYYLNSEKLKLLKSIRNLSLGISYMGTTNKVYRDITGIDCNINDKLNLISKSGLKYGLFTPILKQNSSNLNKMTKYINTLKNCAWLWRFPTTFEHRSWQISITTFFKKFEKYSKLVNKKMYLDAPFSYKYLNKTKPENKLDYIFAGCGAGIKKAELLPDGKLVSCVLLKNDPTQCIGNILDKSIVFSKNAINYYSFCHINCKYNSFCTGCPAVYYKTNLKYDSRCIWRNNYEYKII